MQVSEDTEALANDLMTGILAISTELDKLSSNRADSEEIILHKLSSMSPCNSCIPTELINNWQSEYAAATKAVQQVFDQSNEALTAMAKGSSLEQDLADELNRLAGDLKSEVTKGAETAASLHSKASATISGHSPPVWLCTCCAVWLCTCCAVRLCTCCAECLCTCCAVRLCTCCAVRLCTCCAVWLCTCCAVWLCTCSVTATLP